MNALPVLLGLGFVFLFFLVFLIWVWNSPEVPKASAPQSTRLAEVFKLPAHWVREKVATQLTFKNEYRRAATVTLDPQNRNRAKLAVEDRIYCWRRM